MNSAEKERRKSNDIWVKLIKVITVIAWVIFTVALVMSYYAAPDKSYGVVRYHNLEIRKFWLTPLTGYLYLLLWLSAALSYVSLVINKFRSRRQTDNKRFNLLLLFAISVAWTSYIIVQLI